MRYWFESKDDELQVGRQVAEWERQGKIRMIEKGDPHEQVKKKLHKIHEALKTLREFGINQEVMVAYIYNKSGGVNKGDIEAVLSTQDQFFKKMGLL